MNMSRECGHCKVIFEFKKKDIKKAIGEQKIWRYKKLSEQYRYEGYFTKIPTVTSKIWYDIYDREIKLVNCPACNKEIELTGRTIGSVKREENIDVITEDEIAETDDNPNRW